MQVTCPQNYKFSTARIIPQSKYMLKDVFKILLETKSIELEQQTLEIIIQKELDAEPYFSHITGIRSILPYMLVFYMKNWDGWKTSRKKSCKFSVLYKKFLRYLKFKVSYFIASDYNKGRNLYESNIETSAQRLDKSIQTGNEVKVSPFRVEVYSGPKMLNSIALSYGKGAVQLLQSTKNIAWNTLTYQQLINWPFVKVEFSTKYLSITRANCNEYDRFISNTNCEIASTNANEFISKIEMVDRSIPRKVYNGGVFREYSNILKKALNSDKIWLNKCVHISKDLIFDIDTFLNAVIEDILEIGFDNTIATQTTVAFNIGHNTYMRCISHIKKEQVYLVETIIPRVSLTITSFTGYEENSENPFKDTHKTLKDNKVALTYTCLFCEISFYTKDKLFLHFINTHSTEQPVNCIRCERSLDVNDLTSNRWKHQCPGIKS